jgi:hypothetical protein
MHNITVIKFEINKMQGITIIFAMIPSSSFSKAMTALSVWISQSTSPGFTGSPSFLCQLTIVPDSIVGDKEGIFNSMARNVHVKTYYYYFLLWS